jgi:hypothetical protein
MFVNGCTHSYRSHFLHPFCPDQALSEKVTKIGLLLLGTVLLYRHLSKPVEKIDEEEDQEEARVRQNTINRLETQGALLNTSTLFYCLNFFSKTLQPLTFEKSPSLRHEMLLDSQIEFEKFLAIPCLVKGWTVDHITLLLIEKNSDGSNHLEFFDSLGYPIWMNQHAKLLRNNLRTLYPLASETDNARWLQWDSYNCAVHISWYIEQRLKGKTSQQVYNLPAPDIEAYRIELAKRLRAQCQTT